MWQLVGTLGNWPLAKSAMAPWLARLWRFPGCRMISAWPFSAFQPSARLPPTQNNPNPTTFSNINSDCSSVPVSSKFWCWVPGGTSVEEVYMSEGPCYVVPLGKRNMPGDGMLAVLLAPHTTNPTFHCSHMPPDQYRLSLGR